jgi:uncharacterized protein (DUF1501 family)
MDTLSRRRFLALSGGAGVAAAANILNISDIAEAAITRPLPSGTPILVVVTLYGGNDGLNTVVPYSDSLYYSLRPDISYAPEKVLSLDSNLGLNPSMTAIKGLWDKKKVAIIRGVGYPDSDHSHFTSMAIWQSAERTQSSKSGWLGRWVDTQPEDPLLAINLGSVLPPLLVGKKRSGSVLPLGGLVTPSGSLARDCSRLSLPSQGENFLMARAATSMRNLLNVSESISPVLKAPAPVATDLPTINGGNAGGDNNLSQQLDVVAKLVAAGAPTRVWAVSLGGFDTHANEANAQSELIGIVSSSVTRFLSQLQPSGRSRDVTVLVYSEFGRRVAANASAGTDHGTSGPVFVIGDRVQGGMYGEQPALNNLSKGDLAVTTDFRDIYATLLEDVLGSPAAQILSGWKGRITSLLRKG